MKSIKSGLIVLVPMGLMFMFACSNSDQPANTKNSPATSTSSTQSLASSASPAVKTEGQHGESHGGQVVETGAYHLEFVPEKEANATHMDFYLQKGDNHSAIPNAKVTAQVQLPDGTQKSLPMTYDVSDKHYTAVLPGNAAGQYQVKVTANVGSEKVDGRFSFKL